MKLWDTSVLEIKSGKSLNFDILFWLSLVFQMQFEIQMFKFVLFKVQGGEFVMIEIDRSNPESRQVKKYPPTLSPRVFIVLDISLTPPILLEKSFWSTQNVINVCVEHQKTFYGYVQFFKVLQNIFPPPSSFSSSICRWIRIKYRSVVWVSLYWIQCILHVIAWTKC